MRAAATSSTNAVSWPALLAVTIFAVLLGFGIWGWAVHGPAVFFEMVVSGIASCF